MTPSDTQVVLMMSDTLTEVVASIKAIQHVLCEKGVTDPQSLKLVQDAYRKQADQASPAAALKSLLESLQDTN